MAAPAAPPPKLSRRSGQLRHDAAQADAIRELLPSGWELAGRRVLDFGCGPGDVLRHFTQDRAELHACDPDPECVEWLHERLSPPVHGFVRPPVPPLPLEAGTLDLVWATSAFTRLAGDWAPWLAELHRVLGPDGLLIAAFLGPGMAEETLGEPWDDERLGMTVADLDPSGEDGGPVAVHARWWIEAHWGRAFDLVDLRPDGFAAPPGAGAGVAVLRPRGEMPAPAELERVDADEPRELAARRHELALLAARREDAEAGHAAATAPLHDELGRLSEGFRREAAARQEAVAHRAELARRRDELAVRFAVERDSRSMRLTLPLREGVHALRQRL